MLSRLLHNVTAGLIRPRSSGDGRHEKAVELVWGYSGIDGFVAGVWSCRTYSNIEGGAIEAFQNNQNGIPVCRQSCLLAPAAASGRNLGAWHLPDGHQYTQPDGQESYDCCQSGASDPVWL